MIKYFNIEGERYRAKVERNLVRWVDVWANGDWFRMIPPEFMSPWFIRQVLESTPTREEPEA
jgi:hypothetical protein